MLLLPAVSHCSDSGCSDSALVEILAPLYLPAAAARLFISPRLLLMFKDLLCLVPESAFDCDDVKDFSAVRKIAHSYKCS